MKSLIFVYLYNHYIYTFTHLMHIYIYTYICSKSGKVLLPDKTVSDRSSWSDQFQSPVT